MVAHELRMVIVDMQKKDPQTSVSGFEEQFKVKRMPSCLFSNSSFIIVHSNFVM